MTRRRLAIVSAFAALLVLLGGCSAAQSGGTDNGGSTAAAQPPVGTGTGAGDSSAPAPAGPAATIDIGQGAGAAPIVIGQTYTQAQADGFVAVVTYELKSNDDADILNEQSNGTPLMFVLGRGVCGGIADGMGLPAIADYLDNNTGLTLNGSQAVVAGAVRYLCVNPINKSYRTYFDEQVRDAQEAIASETGTTVGEENVGWISKAACDYLGQGKSAGLREYLAGINLYGKPLMPFVNGTREYDEVITTTVTFWCHFSADLLNASYYD